MSGVAGQRCCASCCRRSRRRSACRWDGPARGRPGMGACHRRGRALLGAALVELYGVSNEGPEPRHLPARPRRPGQPDDRPDPAFGTASRPSSPCSSASSRSACRSTRTPTSRARAPASTRPGTRPSPRRVALHRGDDARRPRRRPDPAADRLGGDGARAPTCWSATTASAPPARAAAVKSFLVTRVGDLGVVVAIVVLVSTAGTTSISALLEAGATPGPGT